MAKNFIIILLILFTGIALAIPEIYESMTLWYKHGLDRIFLKAGQFAGMFAFVLLNVQVVLAVKGRWLVKAFGGVKLARYHRANGILITAFALLHVLLVLIPEGLGNLPLGVKFWPEMVGLAILLLLMATVVFSKYRLQLNLPYSLWRSTHRLVGYGLILLVNIHVLFVSDTFQQILPRLFIASTFIGLLFWVGIAKGTHNKK